MEDVRRWLAGANQPGDPSASGALFTEKTVENRRDGTVFWQFELELLTGSSGSAGRIT